MAERIVAPYSATWPAVVHRVVRAERLVAELTARLFSPRPALMTYVAAHIGDAGEGTAEDVLAAAIDVAAAKLVEVACFDVAQLLLTMPRESRASWQVSPPASWAGPSSRTIAWRKNFGGAP
jgi:hypothetical protein